MADKHVRRSGNDYAQAFASLLPQGIAWPRQATSMLMAAVRGLTAVFGRVDASAADLLETESDPRTVTALLPEWERAYGLPDPCIGEQNTIEQRRGLLVQRMTMLGAQSRQFFYDIATALGYEIRIEELQPIIGGISRGGESDWQAGHPELVFWWIVHVTYVPIWWFRGGVGEGGKDHHAEWAILFDLECLIKRYKPAHTDVIFNYQD